MIQCVLTPSACKRLIAKGILLHPFLRQALQQRTVVIIAGTTNAYIAEEILATLGQREGFDRKRFFRGITLPPTLQLSGGQGGSDSEFLGDVVIRRGNWLKGKTIFDIVDDLEQGDVILKGANILDIANRRAGVFIEHPKGGTTAAIIPAVIGRRVRLILPVGLEKRVYGSIDDIAQRINTAQSTGPRIMPMPGEVFTELDALHILTGAHVELIGGGGVSGAEGSIWLAIDGDEAQEEKAHALLDEVMNEPLFQV
ncbi:MAG: hypothetical protein N3A63_03030 [Bacteroidetes bacterium]|nr:hypothetical protein [Bacteroidota bacterium]